MAPRNAPRYKCNIDVLACTIIDVRPAQIIDLSRVGARLRLDQPYRAATRIHLDVEGDYYWAVVMWHEAEQMGLRFHAPIVSGPLDDRLKQIVTPAPGPGRRSGGFGRRQAQPTLQA